MRSVLSASLLALCISGVLSNPARAQPSDTRQVTTFGILATPNDHTMDPKLKQIEPQLRTLFPNHGFKLLGSESKRIDVGQTLACELGDGFVMNTELVIPMDENGKAQLRFRLNQNGTIEFGTVVNTPLNQLFFCDKRLPDGSRLVMGIGVRP